MEKLDSIDDVYWKQTVYTFLQKKILKALKGKEMYCDSLFIGKTIHSFIFFSFDPLPTFSRNRNTLTIIVRF